MLVNYSAIIVFPFRHLTWIEEVRKKKLRTAKLNWIMGNQPRGENNNRLWYHMYWLPDPPTFLALPERETEV